MTPRPGAAGTGGTVGIVGTGAMAALHVRAWRRAGHEPVAVAGRSSAAVEQFASRHGLRPSADVVALARSVDVVDVCTPTDTHLAVGAAAAGAGAHVLVEKPLARTLAEADELVAACARAGVGLLVAHVARFVPAYRQVLDLVRGGAVGPPALVSLRRLGASPRSAGGWLADPARSGGVLLDLMVHDGDLALAICGPALDVHAAVAGPPAAQHATATVRHLGGAVSQLEASWSRPAGRELTSVEVWSATAELRHVQRAVARGLADDGPLVAVYAAELGHLGRALTGRDRAEVGLADARAALALGLAATRSAASGLVEPL